jgi:hypothetical protein
LASLHSEASKGHAALEQPFYGLRTLLERDQSPVAESVNVGEVPHGQIKDLGVDLRLYVLAFRNPDNIQLELTAPYS